MTNCAIAEPPADIYIQQFFEQTEFTLDDKVFFLSAFLTPYADQTKELAICNTRLERIRGWKKGALDNEKTRSLFYDTDSNGTTGVTSTPATRQP